jgi:phospholipase/carboxylesterase
VLISAGRVDPIVTPSQSERLALLLQSAGAAVQLEWQPGGHNLNGAEVDYAAGWLRAQGLTA